MQILFFCLAHSILFSLGKIITLFFVFNRTSLVFLMYFKFFLEQGR